MIKKGLVVTDHVRLQDGKFTDSGKFFSDNDLRYCLLFWDRIDFPLLGIYRQYVSDDFLYLCEIGIGSRGVLTDHRSADLSYLKEFRNKTSKHQIVAAQKVICDAFNKVDKNTEWSIGQFYEDSEPHDIVKDRNVIEFKLLDALRYPTREVPLDEILIFKERRHSELMSLQEIIDNAVGRIVTAEETMKAFSREAESLKSRLDNYNRILNETRFPTFTATISSFKDAFPIGLAGIAGMIPELSKNMDLINGAALTTTALWIGYKTVIGKRNDITNEPPLSYLIKANEELT
ncbi:hypothetical protein I5Q27_00860 [Serratia marcescens]|nr:hypothetical protein [Serratia marcescens]